MEQDNNTVILEDYRKTGSSKTVENGPSGQGNWIGRFLDMKQEHWNEITGNCELTNEGENPRRHTWNKTYY